MVSKQQTSLTVVLPAPEADIVRHAVAGGEYVSDIQVIQDAIRHWQTMRLGIEAELKTAYDAGIASGDGRLIDREDFLDRLKAKRSGRE